MNKVLVWTDGVAVLRDQVADDIASGPTPEQLRASMVCSRMQGILALGKANWAKVLEYRATATWAEQVVIDDAGDWHRTSQNIQFFGYLLGMNDAEIDARFATAIAVVA